MENEQTGQATSKKLFLAVVCLSIIVVLLVVCIILLLTKDNGAMSSPDTGENEGETIVDTVAVKTPYCEMKYPSEFNEYLEIKEFSENGIYTKQFLCTLSNGQHRLFAVHFGAGAEGDFFGYLTNGNEKISVYIECYPGPEADTLSEEEWRTYYYMMDGINEIARSISQTSGYSTH